MLVETAPAKINLCLYLGPLRADGRHELVSVMQSITLADRLTMRDGDGGEDRVDCPGVAGPNLAWAALEAFRAAVSWDGPAQLIEIEKRIPVAAGLGGGSADAAAALRLAARRAGVEDERLLLEIAAGLGADVPSQVRPGRVLAGGAGEQLERLDEGEQFGVLVLPSARRLRTADVYAQADRMGLGRDDAGLEAARAAVDAAIAAGDLPELVNELEPAARALEPSIDAALAEARAAGARAVAVCGSGPTVIGLFDTSAAAESAAARLADRDPPAIAALPVVAGVRHN